jgi:hypothetical protein
LLAPDTFKVKILLIRYCRGFIARSQFSFRGSKVSKFDGSP